MSSEAHRCAPPQRDWTGTLTMPSRSLREVSPDAMRVAALGLVLVAFLLRAWHLDGQSLWRDEVDVIRFAGWPLGQLAQSMTLAQHNGPLYYLFMRGWLTLAGDSEFALRFMSLCSGALAVPLTWRVAEPLVGRRAALMAALLIATSPYLVWYAQDGKMYATVGALTLLAMWCWWRALEGGHFGWWTGAVVAGALSLYLHLLSALMIPVYVLVVVVNWPRHRRRWRRWLATLGLLTLPYLPLAAWQLPLVWTTHQTGHTFVPLGEMLSWLLGLYARGVAMVGEWPVMVPFLFALLLGVFAPGVHLSFSTWRARLFLVLWGFLPMVLVYAISLRAPLFEPRYLIFTAPAFYVLAARGMVALWRLTRPMGGVLLAAVVAFSLLGIAVQTARPLKSDFRAAAAFVAARYRNGEPIIFQMPYIRYVFDYYFRVEYAPHDGPWTNDGKTEESAGQLMASTVGEHAQIWLVSSESWLWDERGLTRAWLEAHAQLVDSAGFARVDVFRYEIQPPPTPGH